MGMRLEEGVREGRLAKDEGSSSKRYGSFAKKKDGEAHAVQSHRLRKPPVQRKPARRAGHQHQCQKAFDSIKDYLSEPPILSPPVEGRPLIMYLTVLEDSMGCVLGQQDESGKKEFAIYYLSKKFTDCESRYSMLEKTCCALAWAAKRLRQYMINHTTWLISRMDPIKYIFEKPALTGRIARWQMLLSEYDIEYRAQKAIKGSILADHLAHQPIEDHQSVQYDFPDEEILYLKMKDCDEPTLDEGPEPGSRWTMVFDGAVNQYGNGIGAVIVNPQGSHIPFTARLTFKCTNNMAEYEACIMGLEECIDLRIKHLDVYGDSALVVNQIKGEWETNQPSLIPYRDYARRISTFFTEVEFHHIPREDNRMADALATLASMIVVRWWNDVPNITVMRLDRPAHIFAIEEVNDDKPWYFDIKNFLQNQVYPPGASVKDRKTLRRLSGSFYLSGEVLYKRNFDMVLLRCVDRHVKFKNHSQTASEESTCNFYNSPRTVIDRKCWSCKNFANSLLKRLAISVRARSKLNRGSIATVSRKGWKSKFAVASIELWLL
ncbi:uncharacterized protein LOC127123764 [Lathyrus oleraceus]|uniref:uncharacterized protein LOC127123764 n=1 Tax=Pisum sativum TaxID=3888 RepID=UPI0021D0597F|nr:uncharacterized protein LOC127123764 [Pisum sativum]